MLMLLSSANTRPDAASPRTDAAMTDLRIENDLRFMVCSLAALVSNDGMASVRCWVREAVGNRSCKSDSIAGHSARTRVVIGVLPDEPMRCCLPGQTCGCGTLCPL